MSVPATPELDALTEQIARLSAINGAPDWHTTIGARVFAFPVDEQDPSTCIARVSIDSDPDGRLATMIRITWEATVVLDSPDSLAPERVLADIRAALVCPDRRTTVDSASITPRARGSNYALVRVVTLTHRPIA